MKKRFAKGYLDHLKRQNFRGKLRILSYNVRHNEIFSPHPLSAKIEINGSCNLDCIMCLRKSLPNRDKFMSKKQFITLLDNLPSIVQWSPHGYNEPLLHPEFFDFVKETNNRNISLYLVTNGTVLNKKNADKLLKLEPEEIRFSIDGVGSEYEHIRKGAEWDKVVKNIKYVSENTNGINVRIYSTIWKKNINQVPKLIKFAEKMNLPISFSDITWKNDFGESTQENSLRENDISLDLENNSNARFGFSQPKKRSCTLPWLSIYVDVIGNCYPCTDTFKYLMGNVFTTHIKEIYNSPGFKTFRKNSLDGSNFECRSCLAWSKNF